jgi:hypothetical protein
VNGSADFQIVTVTGESTRVDLKISAPKKSRVRPEPDAA